MTRLHIEEGADVEAARQATAEAALARGLPPEAAAEISALATQAAQALIMEGRWRGGALSIEPVERGSGRAGGLVNTGVELILSCDDPHLDPEAGGPLCDLPASPLADEIDVDVRAGEGVRLRARRFATPPERRSEVAIAGRRAPGERISGDDAAFLRRPEQLLLCVADGLGKGAPAREASRRAVGCLREAGPADPASLLAEADQALQGTRGAVMAALCQPLQHERGAQPISHACAGDTTTVLASPRAQRRLFCHAHVLGTLPQRRRPFPSEQVEAAPGDLIIVYTDGLVSRAALPEHPAFLRQHPLRVATYLLTRFSRGHDDALVLVARL